MCGACACLMIGSTPPPPFKILHMSLCDEFKNHTISYHLEIGDDTFAIRREYIKSKDRHD